MIGRRSFFKSLLGAIAGVALAQKIALEAFSANPVEEPELSVNPAYENAQYEVLFFYHPSIMQLPMGPGPFPENAGDVCSRIVEGDRRGEVERWTFSDGEFKKVPKHLP